MWERGPCQSHLGTFWRANPRGYTANRPARRLAGMYVSTGEFLSLEREIDSFAMQSDDIVVNTAVPIRMGKHAGLGEQLDRIETMATALREKAVERFQ
jgi:hypothetical protein